MGAFCFGGDVLRDARFDGLVDGLNVVETTGYDGCPTSLGDTWGDAGEMRKGGSMIDGNCVTVCNV